MKAAFVIAGLRGVRTTIQALAGVAAAVPAVSNIVDAKTAGVVALWASLGAVIAGVASFLQNFAEALEDLESEV